MLASELAPPTREEIRTSTLWWAASRIASRHVTHTQKHSCSSVRIAAPEHSSWNLGVIKVISSTDFHTVFLYSMFFTVVHCAVLWRLASQAKLLPGAILVCASSFTLKKNKKRERCAYCCDDDWYHCLCHLAAYHSLFPLESGDIEVSDRQPMSSPTEYVRACLCLLLSCCRFVTC